MIAIFAPHSGYGVIRQMSQRGHIGGQRNKFDAERLVGFKLLMLISRVS